MAEIAALNKECPLYQEDLQMILGISGMECLKGKRFLITGATGLIGVCLIDALMAYNRQGAGIMVYAVGRNKGKAAERLGEYYDQKEFCFIEQDVRVPFPSWLQVDYIIPLASNTHPMAYSHYPVETIEINVKGAENALEAAAACGATVLYPSSVEIYGNARDEAGFKEDSSGNLNLSNARSCYTESKRVSESLCQSFKAEKNVSVKIVRLSRVFGPTMLMGDTKASSQFIKNALTGEDIVLKSKGEQFFHILMSRMPSVQCSTFLSTVRMGKPITSRMKPAMYICGTTQRFVLNGQESLLCMICHPMPKGRAIRLQCRPFWRMIN